MDDRELLERAAKAAGLGLPGPEDADPIGRQYSAALGMWASHRWGWGWWNPLTDDGDALRLVVKLGLSLHTDDFATLREGGRPPRLTLCSDDGDNVASEVCADDPYAATRRAIVRAAAAIGETAMTDEQIRAIGKDIFGIDLALDGHLLKFARAIIAASASAQPVAWAGPEFQTMSHDIFEAWSKDDPLRARLYRPLYTAPPQSTADTVRVPREPTSEMHEAGLQVWNQIGQNVDDCYRAMIAAASKDTTP